MAHWAKFPARLSASTCGSLNGGFEWLFKGRDESFPNNRRAIRSINCERSGAADIRAPPLRSRNRFHLRPNNHATSHGGMDESAACGRSSMPSLARASRRQPAWAPRHVGRAVTSAKDGESHHRDPEQALDGTSTHAAEGVGELLEDRPRSTGPRSPGPGSHRPRHTGLPVPEPRLADALCRRLCRRESCSRLKRADPSTSPTPATLRLAIVKANRLARRMTTSSSPEPSPSWRWSS